MSLAIIVKDEIGGVSRYSLNLYKYLKQINILTNIIVLKNINENLSFPIAKEIELNDLIIFTYDDCCNIHFTAIEFSKLLKKREIQLIVANDSFELQLLQITKLFIKVIFVLHGDYKHYYATSLFNQHIIDLHLCVSNEIYHNLRS